MIVSKKKKMVDRQWVQGLFVLFLQLPDPSIYYWLERFSQTQG